MERDESWDAENARRAEYNDSIANYDFRAMK